jgi:hypothetical protein
MIDVKKLVTGFLVLAAIAVCSGLAVSYFTNRPAVASAPATTGIALAGSSADTSPVATNAFVDTGSLQGNAAELLNDVDTTSTDAVANDPNNLTNVFANAFVNGLDAANPDGVADQSGTVDIATPDTQLMAQDITESQALQNFVPPNWDTEADSQPIKISQSSATSGITQYSASLNTILNEYFVATDLQNQVSDAENDPSVLPSVSSEIQQALSDTLAIETPESLVALQKSLVKVMVYEKNIVQLAETANDDPVKSALILQDEQPNYSSALAALQQQMQEASSLGLIFGKNTPEASVPFIAELFGVQPAHAIFGIGDITFDPTTFGELVLDAINNTILQILKNTLVALIQKKVLTAIQGAGAPQFVTSFAEQMINSYQSAAINTINSELAQVPSNQQAALRALTTVSYTAPNGASTLGTVGPNSGVSASGNFTDMSDYLSEFNSGGNVWANAMAIHDSALAAGSNNQTANQTQNIAQQGFNSVATCPDGSDPNGFHYVCADNTIPDPTFHYCDGNANDPAEAIPNGGLCPTTGLPPKIVSPGQVTSQQLNASLQAGTQDITSANGIAGLLNALTVSLINQLSQEAINAASGAVNGGLSGATPPSITASSTPQTAVQCSPSVQPATISSSTGVAVASVSAGGGAINTTCAINNDCPATVNPDGTPIYNWTAPGSVQGGTGTTQLTGQSLLLSYSTPGTYSVTVTASTDYSQSTCQITVQ